MQIQGLDDRYPAERKFSRKVRSYEQNIDDSQRLLSIRVGCTSCSRSLKVEKLGLFQCSPGWVVQDNDSQNW